MADSKITARDILALLAERYSDSQKYACAAEVSPMTGAWERRIDFLVMWCWASDLFKLEGFEIKISKSDLRRELQDPDKHAVFFDQIDYYWLVAPDYVLDYKTMDMLPKKWGVMKVCTGLDEAHDPETKHNPHLEIVRRPCCLHDETINDKVINRQFMASVFRAVGKQSHTRARLYKEQRNLKDEIRREVENELANGCRVVSDYEYDSLVKCRDLCSKFGLHSWSLSEYDIKSLREARSVVDNLRYFVNQLGIAETYIRHMKRSAKTLIEGNAESEELSKLLDKVIEKATQGGEDGEED